MGKYFGTDGIRGKFGEKLDTGLAYKTGLALSEYFGKGDYYIARDTRVSGPKLESALSSGICDGGGNAVLCGIIPTPSVAYLTKKHKGLCGIMISASHNGAEYNGIKCFDGSGVKLNEEQEGSIEYYIDNPSTRNRAKGAVNTLMTAGKEYIDFVVEKLGSNLKGLKVCLDCGYGAASTVAKEIFEALGASVMIENSKLRGEKINAGCGALYPDYVLNSIEGTDIKIGFSFDGDADRLSVVYNGEVLDGDTVLYNMSLNRELKDGVVVGTILSNLGLEKQLESEGKRFIRTPVGDKYICDLMFKKGYNLGGEQSGHFIVYPEATTGDGILSALYFCKSIYKKGKLIAPKKLKLYPQGAIAEFAEPSIMYDKGLNDLIDKYTAEFGNKGRLIVRMSGTEPKIRVMAEHESLSVVDKVLKEFKKYITNT
ncbi:MAG: phosphoglucosamine mutase [Firmicutes bacterium]|nr:phosphoglucosamine mutase [Bacillota bacterium]